MELGKPCAGKPPARFDEGSEAKAAAQPKCWPPPTLLAYSTRPIRRAMIAFRDRILPWTALFTSVACILSFIGFVYAERYGHYIKSDLDRTGFHPHYLFEAGLLLWLVSGAAVAIVRRKDSTKAALVATILWAFIPWSFSALGAATMLGLYFGTEYYQSQFWHYPVLFVLYFFLCLVLVFFITVQMVRDIRNLRNEHTTPKAS